MKVLLPAPARTTREQQYYTQVAHSIVLIINYNWDYCHILKIQLNAIYIWNHSNLQERSIFINRYFRKLGKFNNQSASVYTTVVPCMSVNITLRNNVGTIINVSNLRAVTYCRYMIVNGMRSFVGSTKMPKVLLKVVYKLHISNCSHIFQSKWVGTLRNSNACSSINIVK